MCLSVPGKVLDLVDDAPLARRGRVDFGGTVLESDQSANTDVFVLRIDPT